MLGLWNVPQRIGIRGEHVQGLPEPPAAELGALFAWIRTAEDARGLVQWGNRVFCRRPAFAFGAYCATARQEPLRIFASEADFRFAVLLTPESMAANADLDTSLRPLREASIAGALFSRWMSLGSSRPPPEVRDLLRALADVAPRGAGLDQACRAVGISRRTALRILTSAGLPSPSCLIRDGRLEALRVRRERGLSAKAAARIGGWPSVRAMHAFARRQHHHP